MDQTEFIVCKQLQKWLQQYPGVHCWINKGENSFKTKKSQKKPDLIIYSTKLRQYYAVEVKVGNISKDIYDASKIIEYWESYVNNEIEYFIDGHKINIDSFCVMTLYSMFGRLFQDDTELISIEDCKDDNWKKYSKETGIEPLWEYRRTHDYLRNLWSQWKKKRLKKPLPGMGVILSNILNSKERPIETPTAPLLFDMQWEEQANKSKWQNRQKKI